MSRAALLLLLAGCDLRAAAEDYQRRYCDESCSQGGACPEACGSTGSEPWTFHVVRFENVSGAASAPVQVFLEERSNSTGAVVTRDDLRARGVTWPSTSNYEAQVVRSDDGRALSLIGYQEDAGGSVVVTATTARRVGFITRDAGDWSTTVTDAWVGSNVYSAATLDGSTFWLAGSTAGGTGGVRAVSRGSTGASTGIDGGANARMILVRDGRLYTSASNGVFDWGPAGSPFGTPASLGLPGVNQPIGFELLDTRVEVPGLDTLYVAQSSGPTGLVKFERLDGGWVKAWEASAATVLGEATTCSGLATHRSDAAVTILCVRGPRGDAVVRFDDTAVLDGGAPSATVVVRADGEDLFRGVGVLP